MDSAGKSSVACFPALWLMGASNFCPPMPSILQVILAPAGHCLANTRVSLSQQQGDDAVVLIVCLTTALSLGPTSLSIVCDTMSPAEVQLLASSRLDKLSPTCRSGFPLDALPATRVTAVDYQVDSMTEGRRCCSLGQAWRRFWTSCSPRHWRSRGVP